MIQSSMQVEIDFQNDFKEYLCGRIIAAGYSVDEDDSLENISYKFFNIDRRNISQKPRVVHESAALSCPVECESGYVALKQKMGNGENLTPHLSRRILDADYEDPLFNDWGIHHFHLGVITTDRFVERTGPLLYALVNDSDIYCIAIKEHGAWANQRLIDILHYEWPESIARFRVHSIVAPTNRFSDDDIKNLRCHGIVSHVSIEDTIYSPIGGGYTMNKRSLKSMLQVNKYRKIIMKIENYVRKNIDMFKRHIEECGLLPAQTLKFKLVIDERGFHVFEENSGKFLLIIRHN